MFAILFRQELRMLRLSPAWWGMLGLLAVMLLLAAWNGAGRLQAVRGGAERLNQDERTLQTAMRAAAVRFAATPGAEPPTVTSPGNVGLALLGHYAVMPPASLAALSVGQSDVQPSWYRVTAHPRHTFLNASEIRNPLAQVLGSFDVAFVLIFVLPILIVASSFDLLSREKEGGTLGLLVAQGVRLRELIMAKALARAVLILPLLALLLWLAALIARTDAATPLDWTALVFLFGVAAAYAAFWLALSMLVNSFDWRSETNGVVLANLWLVFVIVLPSFVNIAAATLYPAPSRVNLTTEIREAAELADAEAAKSREAYLFDHPELAGASAQLDDFYLQVLATDAAVERVAEPLLTRFEAQARARERVVGLLQFVSPAIAAQTALNALAGTDNARFADFVGQVGGFHAGWREYFAGRIRSGKRMTAADFDAIPRFAYRPPANALAYSAALWPLLFTLVVTFALAGWAAVQFRRYAIV